MRHTNYSASEEHYEQEREHAREDAMEEIADVRTAEDYWD